MKGGNHSIAPTNPQQRVMRTSSASAVLGWTRVDEHRVALGSVELAIGTRDRANVAYFKSGVGRAELLARVLQLRNLQSIQRAVTQKTNAHRACVLLPPVAELSSGSLTSPRSLLAPRAGLQSSVSNPQSWSVFSSLSAYDCLYRALQIVVGNCRNNPPS
jgi:hypothetical protein